VWTLTVMALVILDLELHEETPGYHALTSLRKVRSEGKAILLVVKSGHNRECLCIMFANATP
jgi:hypothetical protein